MSDWKLYILDCDGRLYTGITTDLQRRLREHQAGGKRAAKFTRAASQVQLCYEVSVGGRGLAARAEAGLKKLTRVQKQQIVEKQPQREELLRLLQLD